MGWVPFRGGVTELVTYLDADPSNDWTAAGFLQNAVPEGNPFVGLWVEMAGSPLVDALTVWGVTLTRAALILGAFAAGRILGLDSYIEDTSVVQNNAWLNYFLG